MTSPASAGGVYLALFAAAAGLGFAVASLMAGALASWLPAHLTVGGAPG